MLQIIVILMAADNSCGAQGTLEMMSGQMTASNSRIPAETQMAALVSEGSFRRCARPFKVPHGEACWLLIDLDPFLGAIGGVLCLSREWFHCAFMLSYPAEAEACFKDACNTCFQHEHKQ